MTKTLLEKLGWADGKSGETHRVPAELVAAFDDVQRMDAAPTNWSIWFVVDVAALAAVAGEAASTYTDGGHLWFAYPKLSGAIKTDITRDKGWSALEPFDLLPVMQISLNATWSALRFRRRHEIKKLTRKF
jgi:hypothetical protein